MALFRNNEPENREPQEEQQPYGAFSYSSYQQVQAWRRRRRRSTQLVMGLAAVFCLLTLVSNLMLLQMYESVEQYRLEEGGGETPTQVGQPGPVVPDPDAQAPEQPTQPPAGPQTGDYTMDIQQRPADGQSGVMVVDITGVVEKASSSVVGILSESYSGYYGPGSSSTGTGIILSSDGYIVTNHHVVEGGNMLTVVLSDTESYPATLVGSDAQMDLAVLKIEAQGLTPAEFGDSDKVKVGQAAIAIGNPGGMDLSGTTTYGIISGLDRSVEIGNYRMNLLQTDASINPGNSGGSLLNQYGQVIGVTNAKLSADGYEGIGFAIPINEVKPIVEELIAKGYVSGRPVVGVSVSALSSMASSFYGYPRGLFVSSIAPDSNAYKIGMRSGDIITEFNGQAVASVSEACALRDECQVGQEVKLTIYRNRVYYEATVILAEQGLLGGDYNF